MPRLTSAVASALADWWTLALDAGFGGYTTTDLISAARDLAAQFGQTLTFQEGTSIATLFGYARRMYNASQAVENADREDYIDQSHIAIPPWARDEAAQNANPIQHVTYRLTTWDETNGYQTAFKTSIFEYPDNIPATIGELEDAIVEDAQALSLKYGKEFVAAELHQILAV